jgi:hypothetical protein
MNKQRIKNITKFVISLISVFCVTSIVAAGSLSPSFSPANTFYTLTDIYTRLTTNATSSGSHSLSPSVSPASTFYTLTQLYDAIPTIDATKLLTGTSYLGVAGSLVNNGAWSLTASTTDQTVTEGYYSGGTLAGDEDLVSTNIKSGVNIFGVAGDSNVVDTSSGDAVAADLSTGKTAWVDGAAIAGSAVSVVDAVVTEYEIDTGHSFSAGELTKFVNGKAQKAEINISNVSATVETFSPMSAYISATTLSSTKVLVVYQNTNGSNYGTAIVLSVSGTTITSGTPLVFESASTSYLSATTLSSTSALVSYVDAGNSSYGTAIVLSISGTTISAGTPVVFESASTSYISATTLSSTSVLVAYKDGGNSSYGTSIILSISGTTITPGTPVVFESAGTQYISATTLSSESVLVAYQDAGALWHGMSVVLSISGTTITPGTPVKFNEANTIHISATTLSSTAALITYGDGVSAQYYGKTRVLSISGTTISLGGEVTFESATSEYMSAVTLSSTSVLVTYRDVGNSNYGTTVILTISGTTISAGTPSVFDNQTTTYTSATVLSSRSVLVAYRNTNYTNYGTAEVIELTKESDGYAKEAGSAGETIDFYKF